MIAASTGAPAAADATGVRTAPASSAVVTRRLTRIVHIDGRGGSRCDIASAELRRGPDRMGHRGVERDRESEVRVESLGSRSAFIGAVVSEATNAVVRLLTTTAPRVRLVR
jgi:hypothetical protein